LSNAKKAEEILGNHLRWRVTPVGNRKVDFLEWREAEGKTPAGFYVRSTRPATQQECELWDHALGLQEQLLGVRGTAVEVPDAVIGTDAYKSRDSFGTPLQEGP
jgi:hypothetical protein